MNRLHAAGGLVLAWAALSWVSAAETNAPSGEWPQFRGPNRDGISAETGLLKEWPVNGPPLVWKATGAGQGFSSVSVSGGRVFTTGDAPQGADDKDEYLVAVDANSGKSLWRTRMGKPWDRDPNSNHGARCTPTVDGEHVYACSPHGDLICAEAATGKVVWRKNLPSDFGGKNHRWGYAESVLIDGDKLVCTPGGAEATMLAVNKKTGAVIWKGAVPGGPAAGYSSIVVAEVGGVKQYIVTTAGGVIGMNAKDGKFLWKYDKFAGNTANAPNAIVKGDRIFCSVGYVGRGKGGGALLRMIPDGMGGIKIEEKYSIAELGTKHGGGVLVGDHIYADRDDAGMPYCANLEDGKITWPRERPPAGSGSACVTYADGHLYFRYNNGVMALVPADSEKFKQVSTFKIPDSTRSSWAHPVIVGGRLYLREQDSILCYDVKAN